MASAVANPQSGLSTNKLRRQASTESGSHQRKSGQTADNKRLSPKKREQLAHRYVNIVEYECVPKTLRVQTGFKVSWLKHSGDAEDRHLIRFLGEEEKEGEGVEFGFGGTFTRLFTRPGVYEYYCERHVFMRGEIVVEGSSGNDLTVSPPKEEKTTTAVSPNSKSKKAPFDAKYQEYVSKRQPIREKLAQARTNRDVRVDSSESKTTDSPKADQEDASLFVEFGVSDDEAGASGPSAQDQTESVTRSMQAPKTSSVKTEVQPSQEVVRMIETKTETTTGFNSKEAREFLQARWLIHVADSNIRWV